MFCHQYLKNLNGHLPPACPYHIFLHLYDHLVPYIVWHVTLLKLCKLIADDLLSWLSVMDTHMARDTLLKTFANSLDPEQNRQTDPLTL